MSKIIYNWERYLCPLGGQIDLSDGGFLAANDSFYGRFRNPDLETFDSIRSIPCLAILGEPGIGKSISLKKESEIQRKTASVLYLDLAEFGSENAIIDEVFVENVEQALANDGKPKYLFLDSLDECVLGIRTVVSLLVRLFGKLPLERLFLRIGCRTSEWSSYNGEKVIELWKKLEPTEEKQKEINYEYELAPLRREDVVTAAEQNGIDPEQLLKEVFRHDIVPLANVPITLGFLLDIYSKDGTLPATRQELYERGCRILCEAENRSSISRHRRANFSANRLLEVASHIATLTVFTNKMGIWTGEENHIGSIQYLTIEEICKGMQGEKGIIEPEVSETLSTGLFAQIGENCRGWQHKTYAEYLSSKYLTNKEVSNKQIMGLLFHHEGSERKLVPQLRGVAAWIAGMNNDVFQEILKVEPEILLQSDLTKFSDETKLNLVGVLLTAFNEKKLYDIYGLGWEYFYKLKHPNLEEQLLPYIIDDKKNISVRRFAILIARECSLKSLQNEILQIALDSQQNLRVRIFTILTLKKIGDDNAKSRLKQLVMNDIVEDTEDELKGFILEILWPDNIIVRELLSVLTPPKNIDCINDYYTFITHGVTRDLKLNDLPAALDWVKNLTSEQKQLLPFRTLTENILRMAWANLKHPGVLEIFAEVSLKRLKEYENILGTEEGEYSTDAIKDSTEKRHKLIEAMVDLIQDFDRNNEHLLFEIGWHIATQEDLEWLVKKINSEKLSDPQKKWAIIIKSLWRMSSESQNDLFLQAAYTNEVTKEVFRDLLVVDLNSETAKFQKKYYNDSVKRQKEEEDKKAKIQPLDERINYLLEALEKGNLNAWYYLAKNLNYDKDRRTNHFEFSIDITQFDEWKNLEENTRTRMIEAAKYYVSNQDCNPVKWLCENSWPVSAITDCQALYLVMTEASDFRDIQTREFWIKWAPVITGLSKAASQLDSAYFQLLKRTYKETPEDVINSLMILIDGECKERDYFSYSGAIEAIWDDRIAEVILNKTKEESNNPRYFGSLLKKLLELKYSPAEEYALSLIDESLILDSVQRKRAVQSAVAIIKHAEDTHWLKIWSIILINEEFGKELIASIADRHERSSIELFKKLTEKELADLYIWTTRKFPHSEDPNIMGGHSVGTREIIADWRESILGYLRQLGTLQVGNEISRIKAEFPNLDWLRNVELDAEEVIRIKSWKPLTPSEITQLLNDSNKRVIRNADELQDVIMESLERLQNKFQGETPAVIDIWNEIGTSPKLYRPKGENDFSDYIKRHLDNDLLTKGIFITREARISRGKFTDIHVDVFKRRSNGNALEKVTVIIEVKGCWHDELNTAMEDQLVNEYLRNADVWHGIYLVGWFNCDLWDNGDYRKSNAHNIDRVEARKNFEQQAAELSRDRLKIKSFVMDTALKN